MTQVVCPTCNAAFSLADDYAGKAIKCPRCLSTGKAPLPAATSVDLVAVEPATPSEPTMISFVCPTCGTALDLDGRYAGQMVRCPVCRATSQMLLATPRSYRASSGSPIFIACLVGSILLSCGIGLALIFTLDKKPSISFRNQKPFAAAPKEKKQKDTINQNQHKPEEKPEWWLRPEQVQREQEKEKQEQEKQKIDKLNEAQQLRIQQSEKMEKARKLIFQFGYTNDQSFAKAAANIFRSLIPTYGDSGGQQREKARCLLYIFYLRMRGLASIEVSGNELTESRVIEQNLRLLPNEVVSFRRNIEQDVVSLINDGRNERLRDAMFQRTK